MRTADRLRYLWEYRAQADFLIARETHASFLGIRPLGGAEYHAPKCAVLTTAGYARKCHRVHRLQQARPFRSVALTGASARNSNLTR